MQPSDPISVVQRRIGCTHKIYVKPDKLGFRITHEGDPSVLTVTFQDRANGYAEAFAAWLEYLHEEE